MDKIIYGELTVELNLIFHRELLQELDNELNLELHREIY